MVLKHLSLKFCMFEPEFNVSKVVTHGEYIIIQCTSVLKPETLFIEQSFIEGLSFVKVGDVYECLVPTGYYTSPGKYLIMVQMIMLMS